jgi:hypothetical protein
MTFNVPMWFAVLLAVCATVTSILGYANEALKRKIKTIEADIARMRVVYIPIKGGVTGDSYAIRTKCDKCSDDVVVTITNSLGGRVQS